MLNNRSCLSLGCGQALDHTHQLKEASMQRRFEVVRIVKLERDSQTRGELVTQFQ